MSAAAVGRLDRTRVDVQCGDLLAPVVTRLVGIFAARAQMPVDRWNDAVLLADAIAAHSPDFCVDGRFVLSLLAEEGRLELRLGPLTSGGARGVVDRASLPETGDVLARLADEVRIRVRTTGDELILRMGGTQPRLREVVGG